LAHFPLFYFTLLFSQTGSTTHHNIYFNFVNLAEDSSDQQVPKKLVQLVSLK